MSSLDGRVAIVTGAGRGLGREHALLLAARGARVVVNDMGTSRDGSGHEASVAQEVVDEITAFGGDAIASTANVADWDGARGLVEQAVEHYGELHVLVNNAGILRDRMLVNMTEEEWDAVIAVHLKGHFAPTRWAVLHWRDRSKSGAGVRASIINTSSVAGLAGNVGQVNYSAAKAAIANMTTVTAIEAQRYGVRANAIAPVARTRMTLGVSGHDGMATTEHRDFDPFHPRHVSRLVAYLAEAGCDVTGAVFHVAGDQLGLFTGWALPRIVDSGRDTEDGVEQAVKELLADRREFPSSGIDMQTFGQTLEQLVAAD